MAETGWALAGPGSTLVPPPWCPPPELLVESHFRGPNLEARPDFESSRPADSESGLRCPPRDSTMHQAGRVSRACEDVFGSTSRASLVVGDPLTELAYESSVLTVAVLEADSGFFEAGIESGVGSMSLALSFVCCEQ